MHFEYTAIKPYLNVLKIKSQCLPANKIYLQKNNIDWMNIDSGYNFIDDLFSLNCLLKSGANSVNKPYFESASVLSHILKLHFNIAAFLMSCYISWNSVFSPTLPHASVFLFPVRIARARRCIAHDFLQGGIPPTCVVTALPEAHWAAYASHCTFTTGRRQVVLRPIYKQRLQGRAHWSRARSQTGREIDDSVGE